jgi:hypothetical protein
MPGSISINDYIQKRQAQIRLFVLFLAVFPLSAFSQTHNYWMRSFNEESSLLSGAVVGGGSGPSAIYYNPASISEVKASQLSINASLFSFGVTTAKNALGDDINLSANRLKVEPRFVSYMLKWKKHPNLSFEAVFLNNENTKTLFTEPVDKKIDILTTIPGIERYYAVFQYANSFRDDYVGIGGSVKVVDNLYAGVSMFAAVKSLEYRVNLSIAAYSEDDSVSIAYAPYSSASYVNENYLKMNDYRILFKAGLMYKADRWSCGLTLTTPSIGGLYSDGKRVLRNQSQDNIINPETNEAVPDYSVSDFREKGEMKVAFKTPLSIAAGFTYYSPGKMRIFYSSVEYFWGIDPYRLSSAEEGDDILSGIYDNAIPFNEWLTYMSGADPVFNAAFGYSWTLRKDLLLMGGFRTDFNYRKNYDFGEYADYNRIANLNLDLYYITCGLSWDIKGQNLITGIQYTVGKTDDRKQIVNLSDPVEYNTVEMAPLQGTRENTMVTLYNAISLYFGASFNFGGAK